MAPLPKDWKPCKTKDTEDIYYFNFKTGDSTWDHPCDGHYKGMYEENKKKKELQIKDKSDNRKSKAKQDVAELIGTKKKGEKKELSSLGGLGPIGGGADKLNAVPALGAPKALGAIGGGAGKSSNPLDRDVLGGGLKPLGGSSGAPLGSGKMLGSIGMAPKPGGVEPSVDRDSDRERDKSKDRERSSAVSASSASVGSTGSKSKVNKLKSMIGDSGEFSLSPNPNSKSERKERKERERAEREKEREKARESRGSAWGDSPSPAKKDSPPPKAKKPTRVGSPKEQQTSRHVHAADKPRRRSDSDDDSDSDRERARAGDKKGKNSRSNSHSSSEQHGDDDVGDVQAFDIADDNSVTSYGERRGRDEKDKKPPKKAGVDIYSSARGKGKDRYQSDSSSTHSSEEERERAAKHKDEDRGAGSRRNSSSSNSSEGRRKGQTKDKDWDSLGRDKKNKNRFSVDDDSEGDGSKENDWDTSSDDSDGRAKSKAKPKAKPKPKPKAAGEGFDSDSSPEKDRASKYGGYSDKSKPKSKTQSRVNEYGEDLGSSSADLDGVRHTLQLRTQELEETESELSRLKGEMCSLQKTVQTQDADIESYKTQILEHNKEQVLKDSSKVSKESFADLEFNWQKELKLKSELLHQNEVVKKECQELATQKLSLSERVSKLSAELEQTELELKRTKSGFDEQTLEIIALKSSVEALGTDKNQAAQINELLSNEIAQLQTKLAASSAFEPSSAAPTATPTKAKKPVIAMTPTAASPVKTDLQEQHDTLQTKYSALNAQYMQAVNDSSAKIQELNQKIHTQNDAMARTSTQTDSLQKDSDGQLEVLRGENNSLKAQVDTLAEEMRTLRAAAASASGTGSGSPADQVVREQLDKLTTQLLEANKKLLEVQSSRDDLQLQYTLLKDGSEATQKKYTDLNNTYQQLFQQYASETEANKTELLKRDSQMSAMETSNRSLTAAISDAEAERNTVMKQLSQKELELKRAREELNRGATAQASSQADATHRLKGAEAEVERLKEELAQVQTQVQTESSSQPSTTSSGISADLIATERELEEHKSRYSALEATYSGVVSANESLSTELDKLQAAHSELLLSSSTQEAVTAAASTPAPAASLSMDHIATMHKNELKLLEQTHTMKLNRLKADCDSLTQQLIDAQKQATVASTGEVALQAEVAECQELILNLQQQLQSANQQAATAQSATSHSASNAAAATNTKLLSEINGYIGRISRYQQEIVDLTQANTHLTEENAALQESAREYREKLTSRELGASSSESEHRLTIQRLTLTNDANAKQIDAYCRDIARIQAELAETRSRADAHSNSAAAAAAGREEHEERQALTRKIEELSRIAASGGTSGAAAGVAFPNQAADAMMGKLQEAIDVMTANHKQALEQAMGQHTSGSASSSGRAVAREMHPNPNPSSPVSPASPYTALSSSSDSPSPNASPDSDALLETPGGALPLPRHGEDDSDSVRGVNASTLPSSLLDFTTVTQVINHYKRELQQFKYNLQQDKNNVKSRQRKLEKQRTQWKNSKRDLVQTEKELSVLQHSSNDRHKECERLQAEISKRKKALKASSVTLNDEAQVLNTCIDQVRKVKAAISDREYKVEKFERLGMRLKGQQGGGKYGHGSGQGQGQGHGRSCYHMDDSSLTEQRALHTLMGELDEPSILLHNTPTPVKSRAPRGNKYPDMEGVTASGPIRGPVSNHSGAVNPFQSAMNTLAADDANANNVTDMFFKFDDADGPNKHQHQHQSQHQSAPHNPNPVYQHQQQQYGYPQGYPYQPYAQQQQQQQMYNYPPTYYQQPPPQAQDRGAPIPNPNPNPAVLRDRTNHSVPPSYPVSKPQPQSQPQQASTVPAPSSRNIQQIYSQYKARDMYAQNINQTHSQLQLSQLLHQRSQNNMECDAHTK